MIQIDLSETELMSVLKAIEMGTYTAADAYHNIELFMVKNNAS